MLETWQQALNAYRYPVDLRKFPDADKYPRWFDLRIDVGDRQQTQEFEARFRSRARDHIEAWYEVVYWKMFSQAGRRDRTTRRVIAKLGQREVSPSTLWERCSEYVESGSRSSFDSLRQLFGFRSPSIAIVATFPAFMAPERYPMVDTRIAKWVAARGEIHNAADADGPQLLRPDFVAAERTVLAMQDFPFVHSWTKWCCHTAAKLSATTSLEWRARDVEMAVFFAWGDRGEKHPSFRLDPLAALG